MAPNLIPCEHCHRLYSVYSLPLHVTKCMDNPDKGRRRNSSSGHRSKSKNRQKSSSDKSLQRSRSLNSSGHVAPNNRPGTHTVNSSFSRNSSEAQQDEDDEVPNRDLTDKQPCFVCGKFYQKARLDGHSRKCQSDWYGLRDELATPMVTESPRYFDIPSVDGTVDESRIAQLAIQSAEKANNVKCSRCSRQMTFHEAVSHKCARFEPTVEFYY